MLRGWCGGEKLEGAEGGFVLELAIYEAANDDPDRLGRGWQLLSDAPGPFSPGGGSRSKEGRREKPQATSDRVVGLMNGGLWTRLTGWAESLLCLPCESELELDPKRQRRVKV